MSVHEIDARPNSGKRVQLGRLGNLVTPLYGVSRITGVIHVE
jgi:hypothetical protein